MDHAVEDNKKFIKSFNWYCDKYIFPIQESSVLFILMAFASIIFILLLIGISISLPMVKIHQTINATSFSYDFKNVTFFDIALDKKPTKKFLEILAHNYIIKREEYDFNLLKKQISFVMNNSSIEEYKKFLYSLDYSNTDSPLSRYQNNFIKIVKILETTHLDNRNMKILIQTETLSQHNMTVEKLIYEILIEVQSDFDLSKHQYENDQIQFLVSSYERKLVKMLKV